MMKTAFNYRHNRKRASSDHVSTVYGWRILPTQRIDNFVFTALLLVLFTMIQPGSGYGFLISVSSSIKSDISTLNLENAAESDLERLEEFIADNFGKIVYIQITIPVQYCDIGKSGRFDRLSIMPANCSNSSFVYDCAYFHLLIEGGHHLLEHRRSACRLIGYFIVNPKRDLHQGVHYLLDSVSGPGEEN